MNVAVTAVASVIVMEQVPLPVQFPPLHPVNVSPAPAVAVRVTTVPEVNDAVHVPPLVVQASMPAGALDTEPSPETLTVNVGGGGGGSFQLAGGVRSHGGGLPACG